MASLQIRNLPSDVYEALSRRAAREGRSLAQQAIVELRNLRELERRDRRLELLARMREELKDRGTQVLEPPPEALLREDRGR
jgi:antitoxin FitA